MKLRVGVIGLGSVGEVHIGAYQGAHEFEVVAAADVDEARLALLALRWGFAPYGDYKEMLERERLDLICVATPALGHESIVSVCAQRGLHVLCEKPLTLSLDGAERMIAACKRAGVLLQYGSTYRFLTPVQKAKEIIASGEIGEVTLLREQYVSGAGPELFRPMGFHHYPKGGPGGSGMGLVDHGIHLLDVFPWLAGDEIVAVSGRGNIAGESPATEYAVMRMSRGAVGMVLYNDATWSTALPSEGMFSGGGAWDKDGYLPPGTWHGEPGCIHVHGTKGALRIYHYAHDLFKFTKGGAERVSLPADVAPAHFAKQMTSFVGAIKACRDETDVPGEAGRTALKWLLEIYNAQVVA